MVLSSISDIDEYLRELQNILQNAKDAEDLKKKIVNAPFSDRRHAALLGLGISVLLLVNKKTRTIDRVALADTEMAQGTLDMSVKGFSDIKIPVDYHGNFIAEAIRSRRYQCTSDWQYLFAPALTPEESRLNQAGGGISCSFIYPLPGIKDGGALIFSYFISIDRITNEHKDFMFHYAKLVSSAITAKGLHLK
ncbi:MAG TPA: hypothetical protein VG964_03330 [Candidatus Saccharimonadales bacterium]|nr:hypothetical protein [Candidatus Saccharimonadales bacterium]